MIGRDGWELENDPRDRKSPPVPWSMLDYRPDKGGYVVPMSEDMIKKAPVYDLDDLTKDDGHIREASYTYYNVPRDW